MSSGTIWCMIWSTLTQMRTFCLTALGHNLNQCWLIISEVLWYSPEGNFTGNAQHINLQNILQNHTWKMIAISQSIEYINVHIRALPSFSCIFVTRITSKLHCTANVYTDYQVLQIRYDFTAHSLEWWSEVFSTYRHSVCKLRLTLQWPFFS